MGITYDELSMFGRLRKNDKLGPWGAYCKLLSTWGSQNFARNPNARPLSPRRIAHNTKFFFTKYAINRHKMTVLTPSLHMEQYSPDDNRFDLRPFLYPGFDWQYAKIDRDVERREEVKIRTGEEEEEEAEADVD
ncbi:MAG: hypothetical protein LQ337_001676 [Flavoplaca oasis]|nr:MAG: hypothetical protein LQ337_001676 [Flavoplaca oasis]